MKVVNVRKYGNRKLYDEDKACYVSMVGLSQIVARGDKVVVTCDLSQEDITLDTLARSYCELLKVGTVKSRGGGEDAVTTLEGLIRGVTLRHGDKDK